MARPNLQRFSDSERAATPPVLVSPSTAGGASGGDPGASPLARGLRGALQRVLGALRGGELTLSRVASSVALGTFVGALPLYGLHFPLCLFLSWVLRRHVGIAYAAAHISIPPFIPLLLAASTLLGSFALRGRLRSYEETIAPPDLASLTGELAVGSVLLGLVLAFVAWGFTWTVGLLVRGRRARPGREEFERIRGRVVARYRNAPPAHRHYVAAKLRFDPLTQELFELSAELGPWGQVLDAGSGRGQFSLFLLELGVAQRVDGFDIDAQKVRLANEAARQASLLEANYREGALSAASLSTADTILFFDVLHYLPRSEQLLLLQSALTLLPVGGRVLVRETGAGQCGARLARLFERWGRAWGINVANELHFITAEELAQFLIGCGCSLQRAEGARGPLKNSLIVLRKE